MDRKIPLLAAVGATVAGLVVAVTLPAAAGSRPQSVEAPAGASGEMLAALQRDLKLTAVQARDLLIAEESAGRADLKLRKSVGTSYAGSWMAGGRLVVGVTNQAHAATVRAAGADAAVVARSEAQLDAVKARIDAAKLPAGVTSWYVDVTSNTVVVKSRISGFAAAKSFVRSLGSDAAAVRVEVSTEAPRPLIDVIGGNAYFIGGGTRCSVGFSVTGGFVTAGHCGSNGASTTQPSGTFRGSSFPGNDYAWVQVAAGNTPRGLVNRYNGTNITVAGSQQATVGAQVCRSGSTTGWHCGQITALNASVTYPQGTVSGLIRTTVCAQPGDSGGSLLSASNNHAQGVTSGGSGNCSSGGTTFFQPVNEILQVYGLQLLTGGGTPTTPPTTPTNPPGGGCNGYEARYTGTLSGGGSQYQPNGSYFYSPASGAHQACLDGPNGTDFDVYLQKWNGAGWVNVAAGDSPAADETLNYNGTAGYYRYRVHAYSGSGSYALGINTP